VGCGTEKNLRECFAQWTPHYAVKRWLPNHRDLVYQCKFAEISFCDDSVGWFLGDVFSSISVASIFCFQHQDPLRQSLTDSHRKPLHNVVHAPNLARFDTCAVMLTATIGRSLPQHFRSAILLSCIRMVRVCGGFSSAATRCERVTYNTIRSQQRCSDIENKMRFN
jgi:hypothetical protein